MKPSPRLAPAALTAALALGSCGSVEPTPTPATATATVASTPTGVPFAADVFAVQIPHGWADKTQDPTTYGQVVRAGEGVGVLVLLHPVPGEVESGVNDVQGNIVVLQITNPVPDEELQRYAGQRRNGVSGLTSPSSTTVDHTPAYTIDYRANIVSTPGKTEETVFNHEGRTYVVSLTTSEFAFPDQEHDLTALLRSWKWKI